MLPRYLTNFVHSRISTCSILNGSKVGTEPKKLCVETKKGVDWPVVDRLVLDQLRNNPLCTRLGIPKSWRLVNLV